MKKLNRKRLLVALVAFGLVAAACGSSHKDTASGSSTTAAATGSGQSASTGASAVVTTTTAAGVKFGDLASPCGKGTAKGATANGVTDTSITVGYGDDAGYAAAPGLNKEIGETMKTFLKWCNDQGGINGREVKGNYYDAKILESKNAATQACSDKVFMLVGEGWALDAAQEDVRIGCKLAAIPTYSVSTAFAHGPAMRQAVPNPGDQTPLQYAYALAKKFPDSVKKVAYMYANYSATLETMEKAKAATPVAGFVDLKCDQVYNIGGESDWKPFAENLKKCGADFVYWVGSPAPNLENFLAAAKQVGFAPKVIYGDANHYDAGFAKWNGENNGIGDNVYTRMVFAPFEDAAKVPAVQQYVDLMSKGGYTSSALGVQTASNFLLWATAVQSCGSTVTPKCVLDSIDKITSWTGGGLHSPQNPGKNQAPDCGIVMKLAGAKFERVDPLDKEFDCDPKYRSATFKTKYTDEAKLDANRVATAFGTITLS